MGHMQSIYIVLKAEALTIMHVIVICTFFLSREASGRKIGGSDLSRSDSLFCFPPHHNASS